VKRAIILIDKAARHPFRRSMPPRAADEHVRTPLSDAAFFLASFVSGFIIFFGMIV
jgi:hypothetical protein